ncbi:MAG: hypothetical protein MUC78_05760 [Bacteroidales bacterium]|jgi:WD40 repeat protein/energy-coupling factor transporter ATP-binding protein EcfA2|nr:hypothetical protein [Bacteroidales bacterium]
MTYLKEDTRTNPFPGLRAFKPEEGHLFFGRIESTMKVVAKLKENRFVSLIGASGSGKSSLVMSGVIPALLKENAEGKKSWSYLVFRPSLDPIDNLATELAALSAKAGFNQLPVSTVAASLHNRSEGITGIVNKIRKNLRQQIIIVIDQFEEIFRYSPASTRGTLGDDATDFIDMIVSAVSQPDQGLHIMLTIRSEYVSECSRFHTLTSLMNNSSYLLPQLNRDTIATVIEGPVKVQGAAIDRSLIRTIVSDISDGQGQLPVLQHLLMRMWNHWSKTSGMNRPLSISDYEAVGRLRGAIAQHAGQALELLDDRQKYICSRIFRTITLRTDGGHEIRKPESVSAIAAQIGCSADEIIQVAEVFRAPEYSFLTPPGEVPLDEQSIIDLTHESIIKLWGILRKWIDDEDVSRRTYLQLASAAALYQDGKGKLLGGPDLIMALRWREENNPTLAWAERHDPAFERTMLFLKNSEEENQIQEEYNQKTGNNRVRRSRLFSGFLGALVLLSLLALGAVYSLRLRAERQKSVALQLKDEAVAGMSLLNDSLTILSDTLKAATEEADEARMTAEAADDRAREAEARASKAGIVMTEAVSEKSAAVNKATEENRKKMLTVAKSLAVRSLNHTDDQDMQILLAWQGYLFNERYQGYPNDADIYSALYDINKRYGNGYYSQYRVDGSPITASAQDTSAGYLYTADSGGRVMRWLSDKPEKGYNVIWSGTKVIEAMTVSPDAAWLACGTSTSEIIMIPLTGDMLSYQIEAGGGKVTALVFSGTGEHLYSSTVGGNVAVWDLKTQTSALLENDNKTVASLDISPNGRILAGLTLDGHLLLWHTEAPGKPFILDAGDKIITSVRFIPGEERFVTGDRAGIIDIWNADTHSAISTVEGHSASISSIAFGRKEKQMVTSDEAGEIKLWTLANLSQPPVVIDDCKERAMNIAFTNGERSFVTVTDASVTKRPSHVRNMTGNLCLKVTRNLTPTEWYAYVGSDVDYESTCPDKTYKINVREIKRGGQ